MASHKSKQNGDPLIKTKTPLVTSKILPREVFLSFVLITWNCSLLLILNSVFSLFCPVNGVPWPQEPGRRNSHTFNCRMLKRPPDEVDSENPEARQQYEIMQCFTVSQPRTMQEEGDGTNKHINTLGVGISWHFMIRFDSNSGFNDSILNRLSMHLDVTIFCVHFHAWFQIIISDQIWVCCSELPTPFYFSDDH